jgi:hypothetical protein
MSSPTSLLHLNPSTSSEIQFFASSIIEEVKGGTESPLRVLIQLRAIERASKQILEGIKDEIVTAAEKYPTKDFELWGNKLEKSEVGVSYDFGPCMDPTFERLEVDFNTAKERLEERKEFLKAIKQPLNVVSEDGEAITIYPPQRKSTTGVKVTIR